jgi:hypothetical protein
MPPAVAASSFTHLYLSEDEVYANGSVTLEKLFCVENRSVMLMAEIHGIKWQNDEVGRRFAVWSRCVE